MGKKESFNLNEYEMYQKLKTKNVRQLAKEMSINEYTLYTWCKRHNVIISRITQEELLQELKSKKPKEIAYEYNVSPGVIWAKIRKLREKGLIQKKRYERW